MTLNNGQVLNGRYQIVGLLGQGGFGAVYQAWDLNLKTPCAVKENLEFNLSSTRQFEREATILAALRHPNLPRVTDHLFVPDQGQYLVMDYIEGDNLQAILEKSGKPLPEAEVVGWLIELTAALNYLHTQPMPVIHRDIKPANIKITPDNHVMLVDFGIAKAFNPESQTTLGARAFTPGYSPFEQYGQAPTDARSDIYALGATAYCLLTGQAPTESIARMAGRPLPQPRQLNPALTLQTEQAILKAMEIMPERRFQTALEFQQALRGSQVALQTFMVNPVPDKTSAQTAAVTLVPPPDATIREAAHEIRSPAPAQLKSGAAAPAANPVKLIVIGAGIAGALVAGLAVLAGLAYLLGLFPGAAHKTPTFVPTALQAVVKTSIPLKPTIPPTEVSIEPVPTEPPKAAFKACQVNDAGRIDDKSLNAATWKGIQDAVKQFGIEGKYLESQEQTDYEKNINAFIDEQCDIIITVGFLLGDVTKAEAGRNPNQKFSIVDQSYDQTIPNIVEQVFATDQAAFLAGYLAAGVTKTGKVGEFGGMQIPPVTQFMDGFALGVKYYNERHGTNIAVLGWDPVTQNGLFTGNFESTDDGRTMGENLMDEGADIIMPVAGPVGLGTAAAVRERGNAYIIGVDADWRQTTPDYQDVILTSVMKFMDVTTFTTIKAAMDGSFTGGKIYGTLENGGVGLAPFYDQEALVSAALKAELEDVRLQIIHRTIKTVP